MIFSIPSYDKNVTSDLEIISSDRMFLTFGKLGYASRRSLIGPLPPPDSTAILVYDRHRNAWLDPLIIYECVGVPFQILPFHEPLQFHLLFRLHSTFQKVTCSISENMQGVRVLATEALFTIEERLLLHTPSRRYTLSVHFEAGQPVLATCAFENALVVYKISGSSAVEMASIASYRRLVRYANRAVLFLRLSYDEHPKPMLTRFDIDTSEFTPIREINFCDYSNPGHFKDEHLFSQLGTGPFCIEMYDLSSPDVPPVLFKPPLRCMSGARLVLVPNGQFWIQHSCYTDDFRTVWRRCIASLWYKPPTLYDIALRAIHESLTVTAKRALRKSDLPLFNYELLLDFVLSYKHDDYLSKDSSKDESPRCCDCAKHQYDSDDDCSEFGGYDH